MRSLGILLCLLMTASAAAADSIRIVDDSHHLTAVQRGRLHGQACREYEKLKILFKADVGPVTIRVRSGGVGRHMPPAAVHIPIRLIDRSTAITAHELTHLLTQGWASQLLKEGLAVYAQDRMGEQRGWPHYRRTVHGAARHWTGRPGAQVRGPGEANRVLSKPHPGETRLRQTAYAVAGSWVKWLIEAKLGGDVERFMADLYRTNAYKAATGQRFAMLATEWRQFIRAR